jgi:hypothetical protein
MTAKISGWRNHDRREWTLEEHNTDMKLINAKLDFEQRLKEWKKVFNEERRETLGIALMGIRRVRAKQKTQR